MQIGGRRSRRVWIAFALIVAFLASFASPIYADPPDRTFTVAIGKSEVSMDAIGRLLHGVYEAAGADTGEATAAAMSGKMFLHRDKIIDTVNRSPDLMPTGFRFFYYAGRDPKTERELVWQSTEKVCVGAPGCIATDEFLAAYALAALDADYVDGEPWRSLYRSAGDATARQVLGKAIADAVDQAGDKAKAQGADDVAWVSKHIIVGISRRDAYAAIKTYGLVAYNEAYNPGVSIPSATGQPGCDTTDMSSAAWPYAGEPLPKRAAGCAFFAENDPGRFPSAYITISGGFTIACGSEASVVLNFDLGDKVSKVTIGKFEWTCM
jgi:hypothetical protein